VPYDRPIERLLTGADRALRTLLAEPAAARANPAHGIDDEPATDAERAHAAALMRVNHAGEVAAQALYEGQALTARGAHVRDAMAHAAGEENDHLAWCKQRLDELGGRTSLLNPVWYAGSFALGALAGVAGDRWSLGFVAETERQVVRHLDRHLHELAASDRRSCAILEQMKLDETQHGTAAVRAGGRRLPAPMRGLMGLMSRVMTTTAYRV
jgi:3-demethoxyubiquinol 3-hydroxylase